MIEIIIKYWKQILAGVGVIALYFKGRHDQLEKDESKVNKQKATTAIKIIEARNNDSKSQEKNRKIADCILRDDNSGFVD